MKTQNPFTGRSSGSLANVTASTYLGQNILKSKPLEVRNPQSPKQVNVRNVLALAAVLGKSLSANSGIAKRSARTGRNTQKTARTALLSAILAKKTGVAPNFSLSGTGIALQGNGISATSITSATLNKADRGLDVYFSTNPPSGGLPTDKSSIVLFDLLTGAVEFFPATGTREVGDLHEEVSNPLILASDNIALFVLFDSADGLRYDAVESVSVTIQ